ncbi:MAG: hypothetical protein IRY94_02080 [Rhodospirillaceae bacterium]|nr:hypothetical protein [Rhodospirillaceae bacterium]
MKKVLLVLPVLVVAGAAAWWFLVRAPDPPPAADTDAHEVAFVDLPPLTLPAVRDGAVERLVRVDLALELRPGADAAKVQAELPRLTDAFLVELYGLIGHRFMDESGDDTAVIKSRLQAASRRVLGSDAVAAVLIQGMAQAGRG